MYYKWYTGTKSKQACIMQVFLTFAEVKYFKHSASCSKMLFTGLAPKKMFCISPSPQFLLPSQPSLPLPSLPVLSLSLISDPFFMHYSITLNSHLQCITSSRLSQTHFALLSPFFSHFAFALLHWIMTLFATSTFHSFINSLSLFWSRLPPLSVSSPHVFFAIYFDILCISHCLSVTSSF